LKNQKRISNSVERLKPIAKNIFSEITSVSSLQNNNFSSKQACLVFDQQPACECKSSKRQ